MSTITERDIERLVVRITANYPGRHFDYQKGQPKFGQAWRLNFMLDYPESHGLTSFPGLDRGFLGRTRREAYATLTGILAGMEAQRLAQAEALRPAADLLRRYADSREAFLMDDRQMAEDHAAMLDKLAPPTEF